LESFTLLKGGTPMGFRDWFNGLGKKVSGGISDAEVEAVTRYALAMAAHDAAEAAKGALDTGRNDDDVVRAGVKAAAIELGGAAPYMKDAEVLSWLEIVHPSTRPAILGATRVALQSDSMGGILPAHRVASLSAAFDRYASLLMRCS
jgi:hypothetical protein